MFSASATWRAESPWLFQFRSNWVTAGSSNDSFSALVGIGYLLDSPPPAKEAPATIVLSGGAAAEIAPHLSIPVTLREHLVLEGLVLIARA